MSYRNFVQLQSEVYGYLNTFREKVPPYDVQQALNDALLEICQFHDWNFLIDRYDLSLWPSYSTGTVSIANGSTLVTGSGTAWNTSWFNRKIMFGGVSAGTGGGVLGSGNDKEIAYFQSPTQAVLRYPWSYADVTNGSYFVFQDEYPVPMQNGRDIAILNKVMSWRVRKMDRYSMEDRTVWGWFTSGSQVAYYTDAGADSQSFAGTVTGGQISVVQNSQLVTGIGTSFTLSQAGLPIIILGVQYTIAVIESNTSLRITTPYLGASVQAPAGIPSGSWSAGVPNTTYNYAKLKFWPIPNVQQDLILFYYKTPIVMAFDNDTTVLPNEFEELLVRLALYRIRKRIGSPGWMDDYSYAMKMLVQFREKQNTQMSYDYSINFSRLPYADSYANDMAWGGVWPGVIR